MKLVGRLYNINISNAEDIVTPLDDSIVHFNIKNMFLTSIRNCIFRGFMTRTFLIGAKSRPEISHNLLPSLDVGYNANCSIWRRYFTRSGQFYYPIKYSVTSSLFGFVKVRMGHKIFVQGYATSTCAQGVGNAMLVP